MKIQVQKAVDAIVGYMSNEVVKIPNLRDRFLMFAALGAIKANPMQLVGRYEDTLKAVGVIQDGMVCTDSIRSALDTAFANVPTFSMLGFSFTQPDAVELLRLMEA